jgi:carbonic anhydrase/acetyltransferase-like protein (isoleucine patch superfamily)
MPQKTTSKTPFIYSFEGHSPLIDPSSFIHPLAVVLGNVTIGKGVYVGPGAVLRGDWGEIIIKDGCNVQENCVIHSFPGATTILEENAHIGHGAILHGPHIGRNVLVGMNAVVMDQATIGENTIIGALTLIPSQAEIPPGKVVGGNPYAILRDASRQMIEWKTRGTELYQTLPARYRKSMKVAKGSGTRKAKRKQETIFRTWKHTSRKRTKR